MLVHNALHHRQTQSHASGGIVAHGVLLCEGLEHVLLELLAHTHAVVLADKRQPADAVRVIGGTEAAAHLAAGKAVFDGVADDILADLPQIQRVALELVIFQRHLLCFHRHALGLRLRPRQQHDLIQLR